METFEIRKEPPYKRNLECLCWRKEYPQKNDFMEWNSKQWNWLLVLLHIRT